MDSDSKVKNVARNTMMGVFNNLVLVALNLISRRLFLRFIGIEYLSIGQIINNILGILAFSELGVTNSVLYMLYRPVAEGDKEKIARIVGSYKKINRAISCVLFALGLVCLPFLSKFINTSISINTVRLVYLMNLLYSASSYFCSYRQVLINANQKSYIISRVSLMVNFMSIVVQCAVIYITHNYLLYLAVTIVMGLVQNIIIYRIAGNMFPFLKEYHRYRLEKQESRQLAENVKSLFSVKICGIVINNTDNILVSMVNTLMVGYCANYTIISTRIRGIITIFHNSIMYSMGIASVEKGSEEKYILFKKFLLINTFLAGFTSFLMGVLWDDFIILWLGPDYLIPKIVFYSILLNYYWVIVTAGIWIFRDTNGLFVYVKRMLLVNAILNLVISVILGRLMGVAGVYYATIIADVLSNFWFDAKLVYEKLFQKRAFWKYNTYILLNAIGVLFLVTGMKRLVSMLDVSIAMWLVKAAISAIVYIVLFILLYGRTDTFKNIVQTIIMPRMRKMRKKS